MCHMRTAAACLLSNLVICLPMAGDTTRAFIGAAECEAVKVGPTSEIEFKVQFERSGGCWQNLDLLGRGPSVRGAARGHAGESREGAVGCSGSGKISNILNLTDNL